MAIKDGSSQPAERYERILIYADPKCGKTRLATSLPDRFGNSIYVAWDPGTERLGPVLEPYRKRLHPIQSAPEPGKPYKPDEDAFVIALTDWRERFPLARTLVFDHITAFAEDALSSIADTGQFSDKHIAISAGKGAKMNIPMEGDYGAVHGIVDRLTTYLFRQPLHLIVLAHATMLESKSGEGLIGGPATVGKAAVRKYAGRFDTVIHLGRRMKEQKEVFTAYTDKHSFWTAGVRSHLPTNPIPSVELSPDPSNFWALYDKHFFLEPAAVAA